MEWLRALRTYLQRFPAAVKLLVVAVGVAKCFHMMVFPFLVIYLKLRFNADMETIAVVVGAGPIAAVAIGAYTSHLSDTFGRKLILVLGFALTGLVEMGFAFATSVMQIGVLAASLGILSGIVHPVLKATISDLTPDEHKPAAFHLRYYVLNVGVAIGPMVGAWFLADHPRPGFVVSGVILLSIAALFAKSLPSGRQEAAKPHEASSERPSFTTVLKALLADRALLLFSCASLLGALAYMQLWSVFPVALETINGAKGVTLYGYLVSINAFTIVVFQMVMVYFTRHMQVGSIMAMGSGVFALGFLGFALGSTLPAGSLALTSALVLAMVVLSVGECLVFPNANILLDRMAPPDRRGVYHSAENISSIGVGLAPSIGAVIYRHGSLASVFYFATAAIVVSGLMYYLVNSRQSLMQTSGSSSKSLAAKPLATSGSPS